MNQIKLLAHLFAAVLLLGGCTREQIPATDEPGTIRIACRADAALDAATRTPGRALIETPEVDDFAVRIANEQIDRSWASVAAFHDEGVFFAPEIYRVTVAYGDPEAEGYDAPGFEGSAEVQVVPRRTVEARIEARISKAQALVRTTEAFRRFYHDAEFTLTTGSGQPFTFRPAEGVDEAAVWVKTGTSLTVTGSAKGQSQDGRPETCPVYTFPEQRLAATARATRHIFTFDAAEAGSALLEITLGEERSETVVLEAELNEAALSAASQTDEPCTSTTRF